jgi:hypothetical protein
VPGLVLICAISVIMFVRLPDRDSPISNIKSGGERLGKHNQPPRRPPIRWFGVRVLMWNRAGAAALFEDICNRAVSANFCLVHKAVEPALALGPCR